MNKRVVVIRGSMEEVAELEDWQIKEYTKEKTQSCGQVPIYDVT